MLRGIIVLTSVAIATGYVACGEDGSEETGSTPASCDGVADAGSETRTMYEAASVPSGSLCNSEEQTRTCDNGTWGDWNGTFTFDTCTVEGSASCGATPHGGSETRTMYEAASVPSGSICNSEEQTRACDNGTWGAWSGTFTFDTCAVDGAASCGATPHGGSETRTMFEAAAVPFGSTCLSEDQTRTCDNGTWGAWNGTYTFDTCTVEARSVLSCDQQTGLNAGVCHEFFGANAAGDLAAACAAGIQGTGCPAGAIGYCDLSGVGSNPDGYGQYHYVSAAFADAAASQSLCTTAGGTWSAP